MINQRWCPKRGATGEHNLLYRLRVDKNIIAESIPSGMRFTLWCSIVGDWRLDWKLDRNGPNRPQSNNSCSSSLVVDNLSDIPFHYYLWFIYDDMAPYQDHVCSWLLHKHTRGKRHKIVLRCSCFILLRLYVQLNRSPPSAILSSFPLQPNFAPPSTLPRLCPCCSRVVLRWR